ncbi:Hypothetical_protein [Hexamita inflata]|uniref:Hypothetical_protein n=1 Tax=Hexamita inflata TaxID=28002 RepID=A0AA86QR74_9EUKA|nr:Hypothetical protein HINF_LOCUS52129 [Hexamita inflata]
MAVFNPYIIGNGGMVFTKYAVVNTDYSVTFTSQCSDLVPLNQLCPSWMNSLQGTAQVVIQTVDVQVSGSLDMEVFTSIGVDGLTSGNKSGGSTGAIVGGSIGALVIVLLALGGAYFYYRNENITKQRVIAVNVTSPVRIVGKTMIPAQELGFRK